ncbi:hypothetical protein PAMP_021389 [Pampus punctatissimus]
MDDPQVSIDVCLCSSLLVSSIHVSVCVCLFAAVGGMGGIKRPADDPTDGPCGKKNQPVSSKVFPSSKPARENSPPRSSNIIKPSPSPKQSRSATQDVQVEKSHQTGTLSNKCVSCNKHVHLVQRHLVDGKLYHRNCAKLLSPTNTSEPLQDLPKNTALSKFTPQPNAPKPNAPATTPSRLGPTWLTEKPSTPHNFSSTFSTSSPSRPTSSLSSPAKENQTTLDSKPTASQTTYNTTFTTTTSVNTRPTAAPRSSTTAAKTLQSKLKFFQSDSTTKNEDSKTATTNMGLNRSFKVTQSDKTHKATEGQAVTVVVNVADLGRKETNVSLDKGEGAKAAGVGGKVYLKQEDGESSKTKAAFISKKLPEENNSDSKPAWTSVVLKKTDKPSQVETPKSETEAVRGRVKLRANPSLLADLHPSPTQDASNSAPSPAGRSGLRARTPERGGSKPETASPNTSENESPVDWRSKLKPVGKETKPAGSSQRKSQTSELSVGPSSSSHLPSPSITVTPPASKGFLNGHTDPAANGSKSELKVIKTKPDYIPKDEILKELQEIEDHVNELEKRGVELELKLRSSEEEGEDDSHMDELMVEWFNLIRNKQVAMRRESELVYVGKTQDLEEQQPSVEQELRRLMEKPDHMKTTRDRKREEELMAKLVEIVNDRNAIIDGLDEDRLREEEEDEQLDQMMRTFSIKKTKKKSPMSKLFNWGAKKDG